MKKEKKEKDETSIAIKFIIFGAMVLIGSSMKGALSELSFSVNNDWVNIIMEIWLPVLLLIAGIRALVLKKNQTLDSAHKKMQNNTQ